MYTHFAFTYPAPLPTGAAPQAYNLPPVRPPGGPPLGGPPPGMGAPPPGVGGPPPGMGGPPPGMPPGMPPHMGESQHTTENFVCTGNSVNGPVHWLRFLAMPLTMLPIS